MRRYRLIIWMDEQGQLVQTSGDVLDDGETVATWVGPRLAGKTLPEAITALTDWFYTVPRQQPLPQT